MLGELGQKQNYNKNLIFPPFLKKCNSTGRNEYMFTWKPPLIFALKIIS